MLGQQLGEHFVLGLDLSLEALAAFLLWRTPVARLVLEGGGAVFKELFLPTLEQSRLQLELAAELGDGLLLQQVSPQDGDFLLRAVMLPCFSHAFPPLS